MSSNIVRAPSRAELTKLDEAAKASRAAMGAIPPLAYKRGACLPCGARTERQAGERCLQASDETGEYYCKGGMEQTDGAGFFLVPTAKSAAALNAWYELTPEEAAHYDAWVAAENAKPATDGESGTGRRANQKEATHDQP